jgi:hypothetical protein
MGSGGVKLTEQGSFTGSDLDLTTAAYYCLPLPRTDYNINPFGLSKYYVMNTL